MIYYGRTARGTVYRSRAAGKHRLTDPRDPWFTSPLIFSIMEAFDLFTTRVVL
jgi:hypothetical protein